MLNLLEQIVLMSCSHVISFSDTFDESYNGILELFKSDSKDLSMLATVDLETRLPFLIEVHDLFIFEDIWIFCEF